MDTLYEVLNKIYKDKPYELRVWDTLVDASTGDIKTGMFVLHNGLARFIGTTLDEAILSETARLALLQDIYQD